MKLVASAFPAVGKSTIFKEAAERGLKPGHVHFNDFTKEYEVTVPSGDGIPVFDSDSSKFDKEFFPGNYVKHIKSVLEQFDDVIILVSSHKDVREMLRSQGIDYVLAYPQRELKEEYIRRYKARGNAEGFIGMMENSWNDFIDSCEEDPTDTKIVLGEGEFLGQDYLTGDLSQLTGMEAMSGADVFHETLKRALGQSSETNESKPIDFAARLQRLKERRDPLGIEEEKEVMVDLPILHFPDGSTGSASDQAEIVRYNNEWETHLAENPDANVSYMPIEIMGGESMGDILHAPNGTTIDMAQPGWHQEYQNACAVVLEEKPDALITATIVDVNAGPEVTDQQTLPTDNPEPTVLNTPEGTVEATLTAEAPEGGVAAVDAATIAEPGPEATSTAEERNPDVDPDFVEAVVSEGPGRTELIEAKYDMQNDIEALESVITTYNDAGPEAAGMEQFADGSELLTAAAGDIKKRYDVDVEPTIAGLEGFFVDLKNAFKETFDELKGKPTKAQRVKIQRSFYQAKAAIDEYSSPKWQNQQKFINVGKVKLQVPAVFKEINTAAGMSPIIDQFTKAVQNLENEHARNTKARLSSGLKMFNKLKGSKVTDTKEIDQLLNDLGDVTPAAIPDIKMDEVKSLIDLSLASGELPVLKKADISGMVKLLKDALDSFSKLSNANEDIALDTVHPSEFSDYAFWDKAMTRPAARKVYSAVATEDAVHNLAMIEEGYGQQLMVIGKFIEMWILSSVK